MRTAIVAASVLLGCPLWAAGAGPAETGSFSLNIFQGYMFASGQVVKSGEGADLSFYYQRRRFGLIAYLGADRIQFFENKPDPGALTRSAIEGWEDYVAGPEPGYYAIRARGGKHYLVHLESFENQGKAPSFWKMRLTWSELKVR